MTRVRARDSEVGDDAARDSVLGDEHQVRAARLGNDDSGLTNAEVPCEPVGGVPRRNLQVGTAQEEFGQRELRFHIVLAVGGETPAALERRYSPAGGVAPPWTTARHFRSARPGTGDSALTAKGNCARTRASPSRTYPCAVRLRA